MNKIEAKQIIDSENLSFYNWFELRDAHYDEVGIIVNDNKWEVYSSDERGYIVTKKIFECESDALDNFIKRLRSNNNYLKGKYVIR